MPLYEYRCSNCGHHFEKMVRFFDAEQNPVCPQCQSNDTHKQLSTFASLGGSTSGSSGSQSSSCGSSGRFT